MIALCRSEGFRLRSRRLVWILSALAVLGIVVGVTIGAVRSHPPTAAERAQGERLLQQAIGRCEAAFERHPQRVPPGETAASVCERRYGDVIVPSYGGLRLSGLPDILKGASTVLVALGLVIGASSVGADWQTGAMGTLLTWEPRRLRLLCVRAAVVVVAVFAIALALQLLLWFAMATGAALRGLGDTPAGFFSETTKVMLRVALVAALTSIVGLSIAMIGRSTAASLGVVFVYLALLESLVRGLVPRISPYLLSLNAVVLIDGRAGSPSTDVVITVGRAAATVTAYAAVLLVVAAAMFRARDVN